MRKARNFSIDLLREDLPTNRVGICKKKEKNSHGLWIFDQYRLIEFPYLYTYLVPIVGAGNINGLMWGFSEMSTRFLRNCSRWKIHHLSWWAQAAYWWQHWKVEPTLRPVSIPMGTGPYEVQLEKTRPVEASGMTTHTRPIQKKWFLYIYTYMYKIYLSTELPIDLNPVGSLDKPLLQDGLDQLPKDGLWSDWTCNHPRTVNKIKSSEEPSTPQDDSQKVNFRWDHTKKYDTLPKN